MRYGVHRMFFNEEGWPVISPYRYAGEDPEAYEEKAVPGRYKLLKHGRQITTQMEESVNITLYSDWQSRGSLYRELGAFRGSPYKNYAR